MLSHKTVLSQFLQIQTNKAQTFKFVGEDQLNNNYGLNLCVNVHMCQEMVY